MRREGQSGASSNRRQTRMACQMAWQGDEPVRFFWRGRWRQVIRVQEAWLDAGRWWTGEKPLWFYRVATATGMYELAAEGAGVATAQIYRVYD